MGPEGIILVNSHITTFQQSLTHSALWASVMKAVPKFDESESCLIVLKNWNEPILMYIYHK